MKEERAGGTGGVEIVENRPGQLDELAVDFGVSGMGQDRVDLAARIGPEALHLRALGNVDVEAAVAAVDGVRLQEGRWSRKGPSNLIRNR